MVLQVAPSQGGGSNDTTENEDAGRGQGFICVDRWGLEFPFFIGNNLRRETGKWVNG